MSDGRSKKEKRTASTNSVARTADSDGGKGGPTRLKGAVGRTWKKYGAIGLCTYGLTYVTALSTFYVGLKNGWLDPTTFGSGGGEASSPG